MSLILSGTDGLSDIDGSAATPAIRGTDANTGIFFPAADTIAFAEGGVEAMRLDSSGNLGLGVTPSAWSSSWKSLDMAYATTVATNDAGTAAFGSNWRNDGTNYLYKSGGYAGAYFSSSATSSVHRWFIAPSGTAGGTITFTQALTLNANGALALQGASTSASGVGITFPATQSASTDVNTLDDYEEGTFTPTIVLSTGSVAYIAQSGKYVKIGKTVQIWVYLAFTASSGVTIQDLGGLPFTVNSDAVYPTIAIGNFYFINLGSGGTVLGVYPQPSQNTMRFHSNGSNTDQLSPQTTASNMGVRMVGAYLATA
jgi:hypothetical protein